MKKTLITGGIVATLLAAASATVFAASQATTTPMTPPALTEAQAIEIALAAVPGEIQEIELEREDGIQVYEIEIMTVENIEMEVEIHADTGEVLEVEAEDHDDDDNDDAPKKG